VINSLMRFSLARALVFAALLIPQTVHSQIDWCARRVVPVSVVTADGKAVAGLQTTNFKASLRGTPVQIVSAEPYGKPTRIVLVIDASGSMSWNPQIWGLYLKMADHLLANLPDSTAVGLEVFASHIERTLPPTVDRNKLRAELKSLEYINQLMPSKEKQTSLWEAFEAAPTLLGAPELGDVVLALTDAQSNDSNSTFRNASNALRSSGVRLFWFLVEVPLGRNPEEVGGRADFEDLVSDTGGAEVNVLPSKLIQQFPFVDRNGRDTEAGVRLKKLYQLMLNIYRLEIGLPTPLQKGARWKLEAIVPNGPKLDVLYPPKLADCPASSSVH
jgi:hypothetical protein